MSFVVWTEFAVALSLPFFFSGIVVSLALTRSPFPVGVVYGIDLLGAALGRLGALVCSIWSVVPRQCSGLRSWLPPAASSSRGGSRGCATGPVCGWLAFPVSRRVLAGLAILASPTA